MGKKKNQEHLYDLTSQLVLPSVSTSKTTDTV